MSPLLISGVSAGLLVGVVVLTSLEDRRGDLLVLRSVRLGASQALQRISVVSRQFFLTQVWHRCQVIGHYLIHTVLHSLWRLFQRGDAVLKALIKRNRERVAMIRAKQDKNHLDAIADHKVESRLSDEERARRLSLE